MTEIRQVLWSLAVPAAVHHDAQLVCHSLRYIEPVGSVCRSRDKPRSDFVLLTTRAVATCPSLLLEHLLGQHCSSRCLTLRVRGMLGHRVC